MIVVGAMAVVVVAWSWPGAQGTIQSTRLAALNRGIATGVSGSERAVDARYAAILKADPKKSFFGVPIQGETIGYVVDSDVTMLPYYQHLANIIQTLNGGLATSSRRFGIVEATGATQGQKAQKIYRPSNDLAGATTVLDNMPATVLTDLPRALAVTEGWYADQVFLVLSKHIDQDQIDLLTQNAQQTGAVTNVIAFGQAAKQDLSPIAKATGGTFVPVNDRLLAAVARRAADH